MVYNVNNNDYAVCMMLVNSYCNYIVIVCLCILSAVREARLKEIRVEMLNSERLKVCTVCWGGLFLLCVCRRGLAPSPNDCVFSLLTHNATLV